MTIGRRIAQDYQREVLCSIYIHAQRSNLWPDPCLNAMGRIALDSVLELLYLAAHKLLLSTVVRSTHVTASGACGFCYE